MFPADMSLGIVAGEKTIIAIVDLLNTFTCTDGSRVDSRAELTAELTAELNPHPSHTAKDLIWHATWESVQSPVYFLTKTCKKEFPEWIGSQIVNARRHDQKTQKSTECEVCSAQQRDVALLKTAAFVACPDGRNVSMVVFRNHRFNVFVVLKLRHVPNSDAERMSADVSSVPRIVPSLVAGVIDSHSHVCYHRVAGGCFANKGKGIRKPNFVAAGDMLGMVKIPRKTRNISLKDDRGLAKGPVPINLSRECAVVLPLLGEGTEGAEGGDHFRDWGRAQSGFLPWTDDPAKASTSLQKATIPNRLFLRPVWKGRPHPGKARSSDNQASTLHSLDTLSGEHTTVEYERLEVTGEMYTEYEINALARAGGGCKLWGTFRVMGRVLPSRANPGQRLQVLDMFKGVLSRVVLAGGVVGALWDDEEGGRMMRMAIVMISYVIY
ncbi:hypothetical protein Tco_1335132 [Tanacetum coccineum]